MITPPVEPQRSGFWSKLLEFAEATEMTETDFLRLQFERLQREIQAIRGELDEIRAALPRHDADPTLPPNRDAQALQQSQTSEH